MISIKELHEKTLPDYKKKFVKMDYVSYYLWRPICDYATIVLLNTKITANFITILSFFSCIISLCFFIFVSNIYGALLGYLFFWIWNICDGIDGNIARYTNTCSKSGDLWDAVAGYAAMFVMYFGAGIYASNELSIVQIPEISSEFYCIMGALSGMFTLFPRLITQKKESVYGKNSTKFMKDRSTFGIVKIVATNLTSINGLSGLLLLISIIFGFTNLYTIFYFVVMLLFVIATTYTIMKGLK